MELGSVMLVNQDFSPFPYWNGLGANFIRTVFVFSDSNDRFSSVKASNKVCARLAVPRSN
jgi:hypothetical protein